MMRRITQSRMKKTRKSVLRKSQMKMGENIAILFVFFLIIAFGMIFYMKVIKHTSQKSQTENFELQAIKIAQIVNFLPEIQCSSDNIITDSCVDLLKLNAFSDSISKNKNYYYNLFKFSDITIDEIYPDKKNFVFYKNVPDDYVNKQSIQIPISLYDSRFGGNKGYSFAVINVIVYERTNEQ